MYTQTLAGFIAATVGALQRCEKDGNDFAVKHRELLEYIERNLLPRGAGIDSGTTIAYSRCTDEKLVLLTSYHHMNDGGMYDGWTEHTVTVRAGFNGLLITISGPNRNEIKDYLHETFHDCLSATDAYDESRGEYRAPWYWRTEKRDASVSA
jgi:hypothetical protein